MPTVADTVSACPFYPFPPTVSGVRIRGDGLWMNSPE